MTADATSGAARRFFDPPSGGHDRPALLTEAGSVISYGELYERVAAVAPRLGPERRLILLAAGNRPDAVVHYLAALRGGHPLILADRGNAEAWRRLLDTYDPDVVIRPSDPDGGAWRVHERRTGTRHDLHRDLALLLSTSGSTGSPKLVRLSTGNLQANAESIASYLAAGPHDRAITSLPLAYCYGLSVLNSHLARGASVVLTERSVIEPEFWDLFRRTGATSFAGVPYTFDLLDRVGFVEMDLPSLRYVTQAGGRLAPDRVRALASTAARGGWELYVMYGQTEATARMSYLPPSLASTRPDSIGLPIPGGSFRIEPVPGAHAGAGELVYRGPNVMLGYADGPADLAEGRTVDELRTGDLATRGRDGLYEIVGRLGGFVKIAGLRVELAGVERLAERHGAQACAVGTDEALVLYVEGDAPPDLHSAVREAIGLPASTLHVVTLADLPRLASGKVDRAALHALAMAGRAPVPGGATGGDATPAVRELYRASLGRAEIRDEDSFSSLGGDSLSYVDITLGLEEILGRLPDGWASMSVNQLGSLAADGARVREPTAVAAPHWRSIETSVALRALAILLVVATHIGMVAVPGGAHVLMAVAGFNFARFRLTDVGRRERLRCQLRAVARIAIPAMAWVAAVMLLTDQYELRHLLLVNALVRDELWGNLWFIELLVYISLGMAALLAVPALDRAERRWPFTAAMVVLAVGLLLRFEILDPPIPYTMPVLWLFALGWAASRATNGWQRALVAAVALVAVPGYFEGMERNAVILAGIVLLIGVPRFRVPAPLARAAAVLAGASLYIYLVHWEVWPLFQGGYGLPSLAASLAAGIGLWVVASHLPGVRAVGSWALDLVQQPLPTSDVVGRRMAAGRPQ